MRGRFILISLVVLALGAMTAAAGAQPTQMATAIAASQSPAGPSHTGETLKKPLTKIGFSVLGRGGGQWDSLIKVVQQEAGKYGIKVLVSDPEYDAVKQVDQLENLITAGAQVLIIAALDPNAVTKIVTAAHKKGIPVIADQIKFAGFDTLVTYPECQWGDIVGAWAGKWWLRNRASQKAYFWEANADSFGGDVPKRTDCMIKGFKRHVPSATSVANIEAWLEETGFNTMQNVRTANPELNVVFGSDNEVLYGAISALEAAGGKAGKDVIFMSVASSRRVIELILARKVLAVSHLNTKVEGGLLVKAAREAWEKKTGWRKGQTVYFPTALINRFNAAIYLKQFAE